MQHNCRNFGVKRDVENYDECGCDSVEFVLLVGSRPHFAALHSFYGSLAIGGSSNAEWAQRTTRYCSPRPHRGRTFARGGLLNFLQEEPRFRMEPWFLRVAGCGLENRCISGIVSNAAVDRAQLLEVLLLLQMKL